MIDKAIFSPDVAFEISSIGFSVSALSIVILLSARPRLLQSGPANFLIYGDEHMKKIIESNDLERIAKEISADCAMLGYIDEESIDDISMYAERIHASADELRRIADNAESAREGT